jgi:thiosulfate/3-mercaptopyruvate sulfurtransferase
MHTTLIGTAELAARLGAADLVVVDVRHDLAKPEWGETQYRAAHLPGVRFAHLDRELSAPKTGSNGRHPLPSPAAAAALFGRLGIDAVKQVVVYDQGNGMFASRLWWMLRWLGHEAVAVLDGGYARWTGEGRAVSDEMPAVTPATFAISRVARTLDAEAMLANIASKALLVLDARASERYRGDVEPIDPVAGHIPGALNRPFAQNVGADGTFKPAATLRAEFDALLAGRSADTVVHQCGSGVTACHNLLAMQVAGLPGSHLYPGSWSEWCADPSRPVARGD